MGKGTGEAKSGTIEMIIMPPVPTKDVATDEDVNKLIATVRGSIAAALSLPVPTG
jgi:hypothetical protein